VYRMVATNKFNQIESSANVTIYPIEEVSVKPTFIRITGKSINFNDFLRFQTEINLYDMKMALNHFLHTDFSAI
jgi:hypothetical protein